MLFRLFGNCLGYGGPFWFSHTGVSITLFRSEEVSLVGKISAVEKILYEPFKLMYCKWIV